MPYNTLPGEANEEAKGGQFVDDVRGIASGSGADSIDLDASTLPQASSVIGATSSNNIASAVASIDPNTDVVTITFTFEDGSTDSVSFTAPEGPTGPAGPTGPQGRQGNTGPRGDTGARGATGATGPRGNTGPKGDTGDTGPIGPSGTHGTDGSDGVGISSITASTPVSVASGNQYTITVTLTDSSTQIFTLVSPQGPQGATGQQGPRGDTGARGPQGDTGPAGPTGATGATGAAGNDGASLTGISTQTLEDGIQVTLTAGSITNTFTVPEGPTGPMGATGTRGPQGQQGPVGPIGATGPTGPQGTHGSQGPTGPVGPMGNQGVQGPTGPRGVAGPEGPAGVSFRAEHTVTNSENNTRSITVSSSRNIPTDALVYVNGVLWDSDNYSFSGRVITFVSGFEVYENDYLEIVRGGSSTTAATSIFTGQTATGSYTVPVRDSGNTTTKFLREDGDWVVPSDSNATVIYTGQSATGAYSVPVRDTGGTSTKFLREDGDWVIPTDTTYMAGDGLTLSDGTFEVSAHTGITVSSNGVAVTNPFTDADEAKLDGIATGAEVNVQSDWNATSGDAFIQNKPTIPSVTTYTGQTGTGNYTVPTRDSGNTATKFLREDGDWVIPSTSGLTAGTGISISSGTISVTNPFTDADETKLDGIATGATNYVSSTYTGQTAAGNYTVPVRDTGGTTTKFLREDGDWQVPPDTDTTYNVFTGQTADGGYLVPERDSGNTTTKFLREDGDWVVPTGTGGDDNVQSNWSETDTSLDSFIQNKPFNTVGNGLEVVSNALRVDLDGTTISRGSAGISVTTPVTGIYTGQTATGSYTVPIRDSGNTTTKFLREDGDWVVPTDTNTTYTFSDTANNGTSLGVDFTTTGTTITATVDASSINTDTTYTAGTGITLTGTEFSVTNPFTDADETKLDGIAAGAGVNVQSDWNQATTTADDFIENKPFNTVGDGLEVSSDALRVELNGSTLARASGGISVADGGVDTTQLADDAVTNAKMADNSVGLSQIANDSVNEARLQISNTGSDGQFLQKQSGNTGGLTWADTALTIQDEGIALSTGASTINFAGDGVVASGTGSTKTISIAGEFLGKINDGLAGAWEYVPSSITSLGPFLQGAGTYRMIMCGAGGAGNASSGTNRARTGGGAGGFAVWTLLWNGTDALALTIGTSGSGSGNSTFSVGGTVRITCNGGGTGSAGGISLAANSTLAGGTGGTASLTSSHSSISNTTFRTGGVGGSITNTSSSAFSLSSNDYTICTGGGGVDFLGVTGGTRGGNISLSSAPSDYSVATAGGGVFGIGADITNPTTYTSSSSASPYSTGMVNASSGILQTPGGNNLLGSYLGDLPPGISEANRGPAASSNLRYAGLCGGGGSSVAGAASGQNGFIFGGGGGSSGGDSGGTGGLGAGGGSSSLVSNNGAGGNGAFFFTRIS